MWLYFAVVGGLLLIIWTVLLLHKGGEGRGYTSETSEWDPPRIIDSVLSPSDCNYIIQKAEKLFTPSTVVGGAPRDPSRTSETAWISKSDPVARKIFAKVGELTGKPNDCCEDLQVVRYKPGTFYKAHHDSCCEGNGACREFETRGGQRVATLLVYLNDDFTDGETHFPEYDDLKITAPPGSGILFRPMGSEEAKCHPKALHAGLPISSGVKYVCNAWVRENKFI
jgi:prolyl 4-hydroxylase